MIYHKKEWKINQCKRKHGIEVLPENIPSSGYQRNKGQPAGLILCVHDVLFLEERKWGHSIHALADCVLFTHYFPEHKIPDASPWLCNHLPRPSIVEA
jgi:hypothetical protein